MKRNILIFSILIFCWIKLIGQTDTAQINRTTLTVRPNMPVREVLLDSTSLGATPIESVYAKMGVHTITAITQLESKWEENIYVDTIDIYEGRNTFKDIYILPVVKISSEPFGAKIFYRDSLIGTTPLCITGLSESAKLHLSRKEFRDTAIVVLKGQDTPKIFLQPIVYQNQTSGSFFLSNNRSHENLSLYIAGGSAIITGAVAAYFKISADKLYKEYHLTQNNSTLVKVKQQDVISGISLALSQVSLAFFSYLLFSQ
jgi:hypothetical protein